MDDYDGIECWLDRVDGPQEEERNIHEYDIYSQTFDILREVLKGCATEETISEAAEKVSEHVMNIFGGP